MNISSYIDVILEKVCKRLGVEIPDYSEECDPTKDSSIYEWTLSEDHVKMLDKQFKEHQKQHREKSSFKYKPEVVKDKCIKKRKRSE